MEKKEYLDLASEIKKIAEAVAKYNSRIDDLEKKVEDLYALADRKFEAQGAPAGGGAVKSLLSRPPRDDAAREAQKLADAVLILKALESVAGRTVKESAVWKEYAAVMKDTINTSDDSEIFPDEYSFDFFAGVFQEPSLLSIFPQWTMRAKVTKFPFVSSLPTAYLAGEATTVTAGDIEISKPGYSSSTLEAKDIRVLVAISDLAEVFMNASAAVKLRNDLILALRIGVETAIISGDTDGTVGDSGLAENDVRKAFDGLRHYAKDYSATVDVSTLTSFAAIHRALMKQIYSAYARPDRLVYIVGPKVYAHLVTDSNSGFVTVDKYGPRATILTGELGSLFGVPLVVSPYVPENLNNSGVYDGSTTNYGIIILTVPQAFVLGKVRAAELMVDKSVTGGYTLLAGSVFAAFACLSSSSAKPVALGYKYDLS